MPTMNTFTLITLALLGVYFVWLALFGLRRHRHLVQGPWLFFFRAFFPNWKFYHAAGKAPRLYVRGRAADGQWSAWQRVYARVPFRVLHLLHNPVVNLALNHQNLVDHLWSDVQDLPEGADIRERVTYQLVTRLAREAVRGGRWGPVPMLAVPMPVPDHFQFALHMDALLEHEHVAASSELVLQSPVLPVEAHA
jgi:hypothetical protein